MVRSGHPFSNCTLHKTRKRWEDVDWRVDASFAHISVYVDLALSDVASEIRDWMSNVVVRHGEDGNLSDGSDFALDSSCSLVDSG